MSVKIFADLMSQPSRAIVIFCRAAGIEHQLVPIRIMKGENKTEEYTKMNPFQKSPVIQVGKTNLTESVAMVRYLAREKPIADHWYPQKDSLAQARVDEYLEWQHLNTRVNCAMYFRTRWLVPMMTQTAPNEKKVALMRERMEATLNDIETVWLAKGEKPFLCGDKISAADILAACEMEQPSMAGYNVGDGRPILSAYMKRVREELSPHYDEIHQVVYQMKDKFGGDIPGIYSSKSDS